VNSSYTLRVHDRGEPRWLDDEEQATWRALLLATTLLHDRLDDDLQRGFGVAHGEYGILVRLNERGGQMRMAQIADALAYSRSRVTHTIKRMEKAGWVERFDSPDDGRGVVARITEGGRQLLRDAAPLHVEGVRAHLFDLIGRDDVQVLRRVMDTVADDLIERHPEADIRPQG
jgi:DNA-binding MarR family transcriptional regulator